MEQCCFSETICGGDEIVDIVASVNANDSDGSSEEDKRLKKMEREREKKNKIKSKKIQKYYENIFFPALTLLRRVHYTFFAI